MGKSKIQTSKSKEASNPKAGGSYAHASSWPRLEESATAGLVFKDEPANSAPLRPFDLEERTARFGEEIVRFSKKIPRNPTNNRLIDQLVGAATSVPANYCEASEGVSKKDFRFSISRCLKEAKETRLFLRMVAASEPALVEEARKLYREANELVLIFSAIYRK